MRGELFRDNKKLKDVHLYSGVTQDENGQIVSRQGMAFGREDQTPPLILIAMDSVEDFSIGSYELRFRRSQNTAHCYQVLLEAALPGTYKGQFYFSTRILERLLNRSGSQPYKDIVVKKSKQNNAPRKRSLTLPSGSES